MGKAKITFSRYDTVDYLKTEEDIAAYMEAVMEEGGDDPAFVAAALGDVARARNMAQLARDAGMTRQGLYKALSGEGDPSFANVMKIAGALGLKMAFQPMKDSSVVLNAMEKNLSQVAKGNVNTAPTGTRSRRRTVRAAQRA